LNAPENGAKGTLNKRLIGIFGVVNAKLNITNFCQYVEILFRCQQTKSRFQDRANYGGEYGVPPEPVATFIF
jgi:hypothetical protein